MLIRKVSFLPLLVHICGIVVVRKMRTSFLKVWWYEKNGSNDMAILFSRQGRRFSRHKFLSALFCVRLCFLLGMKLHILLLPKLSLQSIIAIQKLQKYDKRIFLSHRPNIPFTFFLIFFLYFHSNLFPTLANYLQNISVVISQCLQPSYNHYYVQNVTGHPYVPYLNTCY